MFFMWFLLAEYVPSKLLLWLNISCWGKGSQGLRLSFKLCDVTHLSLERYRKLQPFFCSLPRNVGVLLNFSCPGQVNQTARFAGASLLILVCRCSTVSVFCDSEQLNLLRAQILWVFGEQVENAGVRWDKILDAGGQSSWLLAASALTRCEGGGKSCPVLFSVWAPRSPLVLGRKKPVALDYIAALQGPNYSTVLWFYAIWVYYPSPMWLNACEG